MENGIWENYGSDFSTMSVQDVRDIIHYTSEDFNTRDPNQFVCGELIKMLCSVKEKFTKDYYLEYLLTPPDVDKLSEFSKRIRTELWDICLSQEFSDNWGKEFQHASMNILSSLEVPLSSGQLVNYVKSTSGNDVTLEDIMSKLQEIQDNVVKINESDSVDLLEMKPNFFGVGVNLNEVYKRAKGALKKA